MTGVTDRWCRCQIGTDREFTIINLVSTSILGNLRCRGYIGLRVETAPESGREWSSPDNCGEMHLKILTDFGVDKHELIVSTSVKTENPPIQFCRCIRFGGLTSARGNDCKWGRFEVCCLSIFHLYVRTGTVWVEIWLYGYTTPYSQQNKRLWDTLWGWRGLKPAKSAARWNGRYGAPEVIHWHQTAERLFLVSDNVGYSARR